MVLLFFRTKAPDTRLTSRRRIRPIPYPDDCETIRLVEALRAVKPEPDKNGNTTHDNKFDENSVGGDPSRERDSMCGALLVLRPARGCGAERKDARDHLTLSITPITDVDFTFPTSES